MEPMSYLNRASTRLIGLVLAVVALLAALAGGASAQTAEEQRLEQTQARIAEVRAQLDAAEADRSQDAASLAQAEQQLAVVTEALIAAEQALMRQEQAVADAREKLEALQRAESRQQSAMTARVVDLYKQGSTLEFGEILSASSPSEALHRTAVANVVARADHRRFERVNITQSAIGEQRRLLAREEAALERVAQTKAEVVASVEEIRGNRSIALASSSSRVDELQSQENHLEAESVELAALARRAARTAAASRARAASSSSSGSASTVITAVRDKVVENNGGWTWPTSGAVTSEFGWRWGRAHEGIDIGAPSGTPIYAASGGTVSYAGVMGGYGNMILIEHGGGIVTAYAHQSALAVSSGTSVSAGQQIGYVGSSGNSTGPHLHFEVRVGGSPQNPRSYLP